MTLQELEAATKRAFREARDEIWDEMRTCGEFEKVSFDQFYTASIKILEDRILAIPGANAYIEVDSWRFRTGLESAYENLKLPKRGTADSMGYDFFAPYSFELAPGDTITIPTGIRVHINRGWGLKFYPRGGLGTKYRLQFDNTIPVIDGDYYHSDNEGHILLKLTNDSQTGKILYVKEGDAFAQAIFEIYGMTRSDNATAKRNGGFGSTDAKE